MNDFEDLPFDSVEPEKPQQNLNDETLKTQKVSPQVVNDNLIIMDDRIKDIPVMQKSNTPQVTDGNIIILDDRIKDIPAKNSRISFKKTSIILPVIAFIFVSILGMYIFVKNSKADTIDLIRVEENKKIGYIDNQGSIIARCKYTYGTDFYKGYAIVKNTNNLYGVIDGKGVIEVSFGTYYYIGLFGDRYIVSKYTKDGLKQALLDSSLGELTSFKYDSISYSTDGMYLFTRDDTMGILNDEGKEIYTFKVDEVDDKNIDIEISNVTEELPLNERYAKVKVNNSSTIVNLATGKEVFNYTLKDLNVLDNNVFYIKSDNEQENSTYIVINNSDVKLKTNKYKRVRVDDYNSNIAIAINNDTSIEYIDLKNEKVINDNENNEYTYGDGFVVEKTHDFGENKDVYNIISSSGVVGSFTDYVPVTGEFKDDMLAVRKGENQYNFVNKEGKLINKDSYYYVNDFSNGYSIVENNNKYGVIDKKGKTVIPLSYISIEKLDDNLYSTLKDKYDTKLFMYRDENNNYGFVNSDNKIVVEAIYDSVKVITDKYPFVLVTYNGDKLLVNLATGKELPINVETESIKITDNYILIAENYYNYSGKLIYTRK